LQNPIAGHLQSKDHRDLKDRQARQEASGQQDRKAAAQQVRPVRLVLQAAARVQQDLKDRLVEGLAQLVLQVRQVLLVAAQVRRVLLVQPDLKGYLAEELEQLVRQVQWVQLVLLAVALVRQVLLVQPDLKGRLAEGLEQLVRLVVRGQ
jgi:hypothetical protein